MTYKLDDRVELKHDVRVSLATAPRGATGTVCGVGTTGGVVDHLNIRMDFAIWGLELAGNVITLRSRDDVRLFAERLPS